MPEQMRQQRSVKSASINDEDNSASQDFSTPPAAAYVYSPESEEPAPTSSNNPEATSLIVEGSGDGGGGSPVSLPAPPEPLVESGSSPGLPRACSFPEPGLQVSCIDKGVRTWNSVMSASINDEDNSASQDFSTPPAAAYVYSPESEEPAPTSSNNPEATSLIVEGSGDGGGGSPVSLPAPPEPLVESGSSPCISTPLLPGDPALWGAVTEQLREEAVYRGPAAFQNRASKYPASGTTKC
ncbi:Zinc finger MYM-type 1 [Labeo rohita]|uniref:Zinc finger MYM-type 1 n=1 Tax=Labeo rohita TaxID=84645 RepID=A0A498L791_LABRO|nr:Zinc finger MYM-type 1 [Labeo rohita]